MKRKRKLPTVGYYHSGELEAAASFIKNNNHSFSNFSVDGIKRSLITDMKRMVSQANLRAVSTMGYRISKTFDEGDDRIAFVITVDPGLGLTKQQSYFDEIEIK